MQSFLPVGFHNTQAERVKVWHFLDNFAFMSCACIVQRFKYKDLLYTKGFFCTVKVLKLVGWLLNRVFKASMKEYQKEECGHWAWCWMEMFLCNFVAKNTRCEINRGATKTINYLQLTIINLNSPCLFEPVNTMRKNLEFRRRPIHQTKAFWLAPWWTFQPSEVGNQSLAWITIIWIVVSPRADLLITSPWPWQSTLCQLTQPSNVPTAAMMPGWQLRSSSHSPAIPPHPSSTNPSEPCINYNSHTYVSFAVELRLNYNCTLPIQSGHEIPAGFQFI